MEFNYALIFGRKEDMDQAERILSEHSFERAGQKKLSDNDDGVELATEAQRKYMTNLKIKWDENTTKKQASKLIKDKVGE